MIHACFAGFGGLAPKLLSELRDDYPRVPVVRTHLAQTHRRPRLATAVALRQLAAAAGGLFPPWLPVLLSPPPLIDARLRLLASCKTAPLLLPPPVPLGRHRPRRAARGLGRSPHGHGAFGARRPTSFPFPFSSRSRLSAHRGPARASAAPPRSLSLAACAAGASGGFLHRP